MPSSCFRQSVNTLTKMGGSWTVRSIIFFLFHSLRLSPKSIVPCCHNLLIFDYIKRLYQIFCSFYLRLCSLVVKKWRGSIRCPSPRPEVLRFRHMPKFAYRCYRYGWHFAPKYSSKITGAISRMMYTSNGNSFSGQVHLFHGWVIDRKTSANMLPFCVYVFACLLFANIRNY